MNKIQFVDKNLHEIEKGIVGEFIGNFERIGKISIGDQIRETQLRFRNNNDYESYITETGDDDVEFIVEDTGVPHITQMNNILLSIFSNVELYNNNHKIYTSNGLHAHKSHISNTF